MKFVNKPEISRWIGGMYIGITIFVLALFFSLCGLFYLYPPELIVKVVALVAMFVATMFVVWITASLYDTEYTIEQGVLRSRSPFTKIEVRLKDIEKAERLLVPVHFRVGASLYCGWFYVPNVGWVRSIITNLRDAVMITARGGRRYLITPSQPEKFVRRLIG
jgi:hypothetical protein